MPGSPSAASLAARRVLILAPLGAAALAGANNAAYDQWVENAWEKRLADGRLPNVEPRIAPCGV